MVEQPLPDSMTIPEDAEQHEIGVAVGSLVALPAQPGDGRVALGADRL